MSFVELESLSVEGVLDELSLSFERGEKIALVGPGGSGKTVLIKTLAGLIKPSSGRVLLEEDCKIGISFQEQALFDSMTVLENVAFAAKDSEAKEMLDRVGLSSALNKLPGEISGGMKRRVALARAFVCKPDLLLLDDPIAGLDPVSATRMLELVDELSAEYSPVSLIASHDLRRLFKSCSRVIALEETKLIMDTMIENLSTAVPEQLRPFIEARYSL